MKVDISNFKKMEIIFKKFKIHSIFHLAGKADIVPSIVNPKLYFETNVVGTQNILELSRKYKIKKNYLYCVINMLWDTQKISHL